MTTTCTPPLTPLRFRDDAVFWPVVGVTASVAAVSAISPAEPVWLSGVVLLVAIVGFGLPHGALDHLVDEVIKGGRSRDGRARFVRNYLLVVAAMMLTWLVLPWLALLVFLVSSVHHFGHSDLSPLSAPQGSARRVLQWSRGLFLVGLPLVSHPEAIAPVVERLGGGDPSKWFWLAENSALWSSVLIAQHLAVLTVFAQWIADPAVVAREFVSVGMLSVLFVVADPLIGFAVYFGLWHSVSHLLVLAEIFGKPRSSAREIALLAAPLTFVSLAGLALLTAAVLAAGRRDLVVPVAFAVISAVTLPHLVLVERLWRSPLAKSLRRP